MAKPVLPKTQTWTMRGFKFKRGAQLVGVDKSLRMKTKPVFRADIGQQRKGSLEFLTEMGHSANPLLTLSIDDAAYLCEVSFAGLPDYVFAVAESRVSAESAMESALVRARQFADDLRRLCGLL
jgi:hypothetical protein